MKKQTWSLILKRLILSALSTSSVQFSRSAVSKSLWLHESQHTRPPCPSPTPGVYSNSCPSSQWCHPAISSSVIPFSSCPQSLPASGSFPTSQLFTWGGQSIEVSASPSVLPMNSQDWSPLGWTGWISLQSKGLSRVFSNTIVQKHQFFGPQHSTTLNPPETVEHISMGEKKNLTNQTEFYHWILESRVISWIFFTCVYQYKIIFIT